MFAAGKVLTILAVMALAIDASSSFLFVKKSFPPTIEESYGNEYLIPTKICGRALMKEINRYCGDSWATQPRKSSIELGTFCCHLQCSPFNIMSAMCPFKDDREFQTLQKTLIA